MTRRLAVALLIAAATAVNGQTQPLVISKRMQHAPQVASAAAAEKEGGAWPRSSGPERTDQSRADVGVRLIRSFRTR